MAKVITMEEAVACVKEGATVMFGGFMGCGNAHGVIAALAEKGTRHLTVISNDASMLDGPDGEAYYGVAKLIHNRQVDKLIASHVGLNPEVAQQMNEGTLEVVLVPQGSLVEMIRAGGTGLGGVITPTGLGTIVEEAGHVHGKIEIGGKWYLVEKPLKADLAIISGNRVDRNGNVAYRGTTRNFSPVMAFAADTVIVEADTLVETGELDPEAVMTPGVLVDYIVEGGAQDGSQPN